MAYADFTFYSESYAGTAISQSDWARLSMHASIIIDQVTFDRVAAVIEADEDTATIEKIKMATCAVAEEYKRLDKLNGGGEVQSERVGNYSVTYAQSQKSDHAKLADVAKLHLGGTGLMYRGLDED